MEFARLLRRMRAVDNRDVRQFEVKQGVDVAPLVAAVGARARQTAGAGRRLFLDGIVSQNFGFLCVTEALFTMVVRKIWQLV